MVDKTWLNRAAGSKLCYGVFISLERKDSKKNVLIRGSKTVPGN